MVGFVGAHPLTSSVVDADEYYSTPIAIVAKDWAGYMAGTVIFKTLVCDGLVTLGPAIKITAFLAQVTKSATPDRMRRWHTSATLAQRQIDNDYSKLNGHILVDAWGAFESFVDDICIAALVMNPSLMSSGQLAKVRADQSWSALPENERARKMLRRALGKIKDEDKIGFSRLKKQLELVNLDCDGSPELESRVTYAQQLRHVIVHRGGIADGEFIDRSGRYSRHAVGETLTVDSSMLKELLGALIVYGLLIVNSDRTAKGAPPALWPLITPDPALESPYKDEWGYLSRETGWFAEPWLPLFYQVEL